MASSWFPTTGQPADNVGVDGDFARDAVARIDWGPKGRMTAGSWAGTAIAINGPTGQAILSGTGAPGSQLGNNGQSYFDAVAGTTYLKSSNAWTAVGTTIGPQGVPGPSNLGALGASFGPVPVTNSIALTSTPTTLPVAASTLPCQFTPITPSAFLGAYVQSYFGAAITLSLVDQATGTAVYSTPIAANGQFTTGTAFFPITSYPLVAGKTYVWQASSATSQTASLVVYPIYVMPSASPAQQIGAFPLMGFATSTTLTTTAATLPTFGSTVAPYYIPVRNAGQYAAQATFTATGTTATTATAQITLYYQALSGGTIGTTGGWPVTITADGVTRTVFGPSTDTTAFNTGYRFFWQIKAAATMTATLQFQMYGFV